MLLALAAGALVSAPARAAKDDFKLELEGYYRTRGYVFPDLYDGQEGYGGKYMQQRARIQPQVNFQERAKFFMMADVLDDVLWGDNQSYASTALFAADPSATNLDGQETDAFNLKRAWIEFKVPVGLVRVGRMPSNWGMGLLANAGEGFDDTFGENHGGSTYDRVIFATRPITVATTVAQMVTGQGKVHDVPLIAAIGVDRLVEDPLIQYYGYKCDPEETEADGEDPRCAATDDHSYTDDERLAQNRADTWWVDPGDDVMEVIYVLLYKAEDTKIAGVTGDLTTGVYMVNRKQTETNSNVWIRDFYLRALFANLYAETEIINIRGETEAIALAGSYDPSLPNPLHKTADIWGYVAKGGYESLQYAAIFETGFASGDEAVADESFTGRPLHSEYNVGLLLYEEILARTTAAVWTDAANGLWSKGGVYNSRYIFPHVKWRPMDNWEFIAAYLLAWPHKPDGANILCREADQEEFGCTPPTEPPVDDWLGKEWDFAAKHRWHEHLLWSMEYGRATVSDRVPVETAGLDPSRKYWTLQTRIAYEF